MEANSKLFKLALDGGFILAVITASLYASGSAYYHGYLASWGIDKTLIPKTFHQTMYQGLLSWFELGFPVILFSIFACLLAFLVLGFIFFLIIESQKIKKVTVRILRFIRGRKNKKTHKLSEVKTIKFLGMLSSILFGFLISMLILLSFLAYFEHKGIQKGEELIENKRNKSDKLDNQYMVSENAKNSAFIIVSCSPQICAVAEEVSAQLKYIDPKTFKVVGNQEK